jgi:protease-4
MKRRSFRRIIFLMVALLAVAWWLSPRGVAIEPGSVLELEIGGAYVESADPPLVARLLGPTPQTLASLLSSLAIAERDDRISAVVLRIRALHVGWGKAQEIRDAIARLAARGRRTIAYLELEGMSANLEYYVASAAQEVYVGEASHVGLVGLAGEYLFFGGFFEKLGVDIEVERVGRYKTAADTFAGKEMSEAHREMAGALLDSIDAQFIAGIAKSRAITEDAVREAIDAALSNPADLASFGLIDGVEGYEAVVARAGDGPRVKSETWLGVDPASVGFEPAARFALVYASGNIVTGRGGATPFGGALLGSETLVKALDDAAADSEIDAILLRIDSPGGSVLASEQIWSAVVRARESGKPIVASFSDVAASGGYYIAAAADAIVASPSSITGSIGVLVLRPVFERLFDELDIGAASLTRGAHADLQLTSRPLSPASRALLRREVDSIYELFVKRVAEGRPLDSPGVDLVGRGRVWTGAQAAERGLVDRLGGLRAAAALAKEKLGLDPEADVSLVAYPPPRSVAEQIAEALTQVRLRALDSAPLTRVTRRLEPWIDAANDRRPVVLLPFAMEVR